MPIAPAIPVGGLAGLRFLERTLPQQTATFNQSPDVEREIAYFLDKADTITSAEELVSDRRLLSVVVGAFGLDDELDKRQFLQRVIGEGVVNSSSFANQLVQPEFREMSEVLGFGDPRGRLVQDATRQTIVAAYLDVENKRENGPLATRINVSDTVDEKASYFLQNAGAVTSIDVFLSDFTLRDVVLTAFGLDEEDPNTSTIRRVLAEGAESPNAFANLLQNEGYAAMSRSLGFGDQIGNLVFEDVQNTIVQRYRERQFERAVGEQDVDLRLALNFNREAINIANGSDNERLVLLNMLGSEPIRQVLEGALFLPTSFALIDVDQQVEVVKERLGSLFGDSKPETLRDADNIRTLTERFLLRQQQVNGSTVNTSSAATALTVLQSGSLGAGAQQNLFASNFI